MDWIKSLQRTIDYIEKHITEPVDYENIARQMNVSVFYFHRIFTIICGITPAEYIRNRRLTLAGSELFSTDNKIIDIALKYGYDTPESFSRAFTRFHGFTPNAVRRNNLPLKSFVPLKFSISVKGGKIMNYRITEKEAFTVLEKVEVHNVITEENKNDIYDFWDRAKADGTVQTLVNAMSKEAGNLFGICYNSTGSEPEKFEYSIAAVCSADCDVPDGYRINEIPARTWAVFECTGAMPDAIQETWKKICTEFFPASEYTPTYEMDIEDYPDGDITSPEYKSYIWVAVEKK